MLLRPSHESARAEHDRSRKVSLVLKAEVQEKEAQVLARVEAESSTDEAETKARKTENRAYENENCTWKAEVRERGRHAVS